MKCVIIAGGELVPTPRINRILKSGELIVCADGGARHLRSLDIQPHVLMGDFDSIHRDDLAFLIEKEVEIIEFPARKDLTDTELCVEWAIDQNVNEVVLLGAIGSRMDHTLANIFLLKKLADKGIFGRVINANNELLVIHDRIRDQITLNGKKGEILSILPLSRTVTGITLEGFEYPLSEARIEMGSSLGISNCFARERVRIRIRKGILLVSRSKD
ncbi:MAG: thiamine diphosphokinase [Desulfobacterales bacterium]|nr:thiamine diphosphokinase [Desulfobacterales bacterium]